MFRGGFGRPPMVSHEDDDDEEDGGAALLAAHRADASDDMGEDLGRPANMNELLRLAGMLGGESDETAPDNEDDDNNDDDEDDEDIDETLMERIVGLTEMFPDSFRNLMEALITGSASAIKWSWVNGRSLAWAVTATSMVAIMPVVLERERHQFQQEQAARDRQILLGPGAASPSAAGHSMYGGLVPPGLK